MTDTPKEPKSKWGYGQTDPATHWKKGCPSPNPKGRPKGSKNQKTIWNETSSIKVDVNVDGKSSKMSKKEVKYHQLNDKAASGDLKAIAMANELDAKFDPIDTELPTGEESAADFQTLDEWVNLLKKFEAFKNKPGKSTPKQEQGAGDG